MSLLNCVGCVVTWVMWDRGLRGPMGCVGHIFTWVVWVAGVEYIFAWVKIICVGQFFYVGHHFFRDLKFFESV